MFKKIASVFLIVLFLSALLYNVKAVESSSGKEIFIKAKCNMCHSITSQSIEAKKKSDNTPDLSNIGTKFKADFLKTYLKKESEQNGKKHQIAFKGEDADFETLINWLLTLKTSK